MLQEKRGQVAGAFYREDLGEKGGYIDLIWGADAKSVQGLKGANGKLLKPYGLSKIVEKHIDDFSPFAGDTPFEKLARGIEEITQQGIIVNKDGVHTIWLKRDDGYYLVGLSKGWFGKGNNAWVVTSYKKAKGEIPEELKGDSANLSAYSTKFNPALTSADEPLSTPHSTKPPLKAQEIADTRPYAVIEDKEAFIKNLDLSASATPIPASIDVEGFLKSLKGVKNHKNFIEHLADHKNGEKRLAYLNLVEPTLKTPSLKLVFNDPPKTEYVKSFLKDGQHLIYILITKENDRLLITGIPDVKMRYIKKQIRDASLIHSFTSL
ncbi:putative barnase/colicin E5 family endoribonuclease [Helicobacter heilmannii]|uniref:putative barnase/colicin E5 family endoribonuclease n=1 Tax=Helicobacter heilmannii TaxID=35817 RepID=UPI000CF136E7|nr:hypothetical protein [Helicobacter heilmannii]